MTERTNSIAPQIATQSQPAINVVATTTVKDALAPTDPVDEEAYIIKCICDYSDDDGNTIYCETCDTWQHIECFYHGNVEAVSRDDFSHFCADCKPRPLDRRKAAERQRQQRQDRPLQDTHDKKSKRPPAKNHKKKPKPSDVQVNGYHFDPDAGHSTKAGSPIEAHSSHKKSKSTHRVHSIGSQLPKRSPPHTSRHRANGHPLSPATTPPDLPDGFHIHSYSKHLQDLYCYDPGAQQQPANIFASLAVSDTMSLWLRDPDKLRADSGVQEPLDVFRIVKPDVYFEAQKWTKLQVNSKEVVANGSILWLRYLTVVNPLQEKDLVVGELKGFVGFQKDYYIEDPDRFMRLCHPVPFVFFHPRLPLYIDTRREGSQCRYIRRSCQSNATLDTYITNQSEYHFCIINERPLSPGEQVTLAWDFRFKTEVRARYLYLLGLSDDDGVGEPEVSEHEYAELRELIDNVLTDYGGCACGLGSECAFARFHRQYLGKAHSQSNGLKHKKGRKLKQHVSPTSTGRATNSRDASEGRQEPYDAEDDSRSTSGSVRSKPRSRDITPFTPLLDADLITSDLVSEREKRKLMDIEKTFERLDQQAQPPRKKKRISDGSGTNNAMTGSQKTKQKQSRCSVSNASSTTANGSSTRQYKDIGTFQHDSDSPTTAAHSPVAPMTTISRQPSHPISIPMRSRQQTPAHLCNYTDVSIQTDPTDDWYSISTSSIKAWVPLAKRLLNSRRSAWFEKRSRHLEQTNPTITGNEPLPVGHTQSSEVKEKDSKPSGHGQTAPFTGEKKDLSTDDVSIELTEKLSISVDVPMPDAPPSNPVPIEKPPKSLRLVSVPLNPSTANEHRTQDLRLQLSSIPPFSSRPSAIQPTSGGSATPSSTNGSTAQSPFGLPFSPMVPGQPSPARKKLSLKDYKARYASANKALSTDGEPTSANAKPSPLAEESKIPALLEGVIPDSPVMEKGSEPLADTCNTSESMQPAAS